MKLDFGQDSTTNPNNSGGEDWSSSSGVSGSSSSSSSSSWRDPQSVWGGQSPYLQGLYEQGAGMFGAGGQDQAMQQRGTGVFNTAMDSYNRLSNPGVNPQLQAYSGEVQRNLERNLLPAIGSDAQGFGQMGGSRQGVAEGLAVGDSNQQITDMASNLYNADMNRMGQAMSMAPGLANFGMGIPWQGMNQYAGLLGDPTVLGGAAGSDSSSSSSAFGEESSNSYGYRYDTGGGTDDRGWNIGIGIPGGGASTG